MSYLVTVNPDGTVTLGDTVEHLAVYPDGTVKIVSSETFTPKRIVFEGEPEVELPERPIVIISPSNGSMRSDTLPTINTSRAYVEAAVKQGKPIIDGTTDVKMMSAEEKLELILKELEHAKLNDHHLSSDCQGVAPGEHAPAVRIDNIEWILNV